MSHVSPRPVRRPSEFPPSIPVLETPRLVLRGHALADFADSARMWADPQVTRFIGGRPSTEEEAWARFLRYPGHWALLGYGYWVVVEKATGGFVGEVGLADFRREMTPSFAGEPEAGWALATWRTESRRGVVRDQAVA